MSKTLTYSSFAVASLLVILAFLTAKSYTQLTIAIVLFPALAYFALSIFPRKDHTTTLTIKIPLMPVPKVETLKRERVDVVDVDKRTFLKLIGAAGISFFLFSILGDRVKSLLLGGSAAPGTTAVGGSTGSGVDTPQVIPTAGYSVSEIDEGVISYYGFTNKDGGWLIMREDATNNTFRYAKGDSNFPGNWANHASLKYDYYHNLF